MATRKPTVSTKPKKAQGKAEKLMTGDIERKTGQSAEARRMNAQRAGELEAETARRAGVKPKAEKRMSGARFEEYVRAAMTGLCAYGAHDTAPRGAALRAVQIARDTMAAVDESPSERDVAARSSGALPLERQAGISSPKERQAGTALPAERVAGPQPVVGGPYEEVQSQKRRSVTTRQRSR